MVAPSVVRLANEADRLEVWRLILQGHKENCAFELSPQKVEWWLNRLLNPDSIPDSDMGPRGVIGVIGPQGALEGLVILVIGSYWYTDSRHLEEYMVFIDPECRASDHAKVLIEWMKEQSKQTKLALVAGIISNDKTEAKCKLYGRFLPKAGEFFVYGLEKFK